MKEDKNKNRGKSSVPSWQKGKEALGIDIGTTTISAAVVDITSKAVLKAYTIQNNSFIDADTQWEKLQDPHKILGQTLKLLDEIFENHKSISVIGLTGQMHGILYLDKEGRPVSPLYTWQDGRGDEACFQGKSVCELLRQNFNLKSHTGYGLVTHIYNSLKGEVPEEAASLCTIMDYLGMVLAGMKSPVMHRSNAASLGLYDVEKASFRKDIFHEMNIDDTILPEITDGFHILGSYKKIPVCVAIGDNQTSFLGSVKDMSDTILINMGTGGQISVFSRKYFAEEGIEARPFIKDTYLLVGSSLCGGRAYAVLEQFFRQYAEAMGIYDADHYEIMDSILRSSDETKEKLYVNTSFSGTREAPHKRGSITNIGTLNFTPAALISGVLEGMTDELYHMYEKIECGIGNSKSKIAASGNGIRKNTHLQEMMSKRFSMRIQMAEYEEEAAYGAALAAYTYCTEEMDEKEQME